MSPVGVENIGVEVVMEMLCERSFAIFRHRSVKDINVQCYPNRMLQSLDL